MSQPVKVLAIVYKLNAGGAESRLMDLLRHMDSSRVRIDIFTYQMDPGVYDEEVRALGGTVYYNPPLTVKNMFWYVGYFRDFLKKHPEYRIIHAYQDAWCSVFCKGAWQAGVPVRIARSGTEITTKDLASTVKNIIRLPAKKYANYYFAVSEKAGRWLFGDRLYDEGKVRIWPNAIEAERFYYNEEIRQEIREEYGWQDKWIVMHVGNMTPPKNHAFILRVFKEIAEKDPAAHLVLIGKTDTPYTEIRESADTFIRDNHLEERITLLGPRQDVNRLLQGGDVFLFPSVFEGLPGALIEAQASGLPCVLSDTIAREVYVVPDLTVLPLTDAPEKWADEVLKYRGYKRGCTRQYIEEKNYDVRAVAEQMCAFYESALKQ